MSTYTDDQRELAVSRYQAVGCNEAARETGIPQATVSRWANAAGVGTFQLKDDEATNEARMARLKENCYQIALAGTEATLEAIERDGADVKCHQLVGAWTRAIHDYQLLTGQATERVADDAKERVIAQMDELKARKQRNAEAA